MRASNPIATWLTGAAFVIALPSALLWAALFNGYPLVTPDSGNYVHFSQFFPSELPPQRSLFYSLFIKIALGVWRSAWSVVAAQALIVAYTVFETVRCLVPPRLVSRFYVGALSLLCLVTSVSWHTSQLMPDVFTGTLCLSAFALAFRASGLSWPRRLALGSVFLASLLFHLSHYASLVIAVALFFPGLLLWRVRHGIAKNGATILTLLFIASLGLTVGTDLALKGEVAFSSAGSSFVVARLVNDGIVHQLLSEHCAQENYCLCSYQQALTHRTSDEYLWGDDTPFWKCGGWDARGHDEARRIILDSLRFYPLANAIAAASAGTRQFFDFEATTGLTAFAEPLYPSLVLKKNLRSEYAAYAQSRQTQGRLLPSLEILDYFYRAVAGLALLFVAGFLVRALWGRRPRELQASELFCAWVVAFLVANAAVTGIISNVSGRYQSRVVWVVVLASLIILGTGATSRGHFESPNRHR